MLGGAGGGDLPIQITFAVDTMPDMNADLHVNIATRRFPRNDETRTTREIINLPKTLANKKEHLIMEWTHYLSYFFGGAFFTNALPHFVSGLMGRSFQSPFAKPPGEGLSSSTVNVLWGFFNLAVGYVLICHVGNFNLRSTDHIFALALGILFISLMSARMFGRFHGGNTPAGTR